jgi:hypothetical protein
VFSINVPVGVVLAAMAAIFLPTDMRDPRRSGRFDLGGALTVTDLRAAGGPTAWGLFEADVVEPARR